MRTKNHKILFLIVLAAGITSSISVSLADEQWSVDFENGFTSTSGTINIYNGNINNPGDTSREVHVTVDPINANNHALRMQRISETAPTSLLGYTNIPSSVQLSADGYISWKRYYPQVYHPIYGYERMDMAWALSSGSQSQQCNMLQMGSPYWGLSNTLHLYDGTNGFSECTFNTPAFSYGQWHTFALSWKDMGTADEDGEEHGKVAGKGYVVVTMSMDGVNIGSHEILRASFDPEVLSVGCEWNGGSLPSFYQTDQYEVGDLIDDVEIGNLLEDSIIFNDVNVPTNSYTQISLPALPHKDGKVIVIRFNEYSYYGVPAGYYPNLSLELNSTLISRYMNNGNERLIARDPNFILFWNGNTYPVFSGTAIASMYAPNYITANNMTDDGLGATLELNISDMVNGASGNILKINNLSSISRMLVKNIKIGWMDKRLLPVLPNAVPQRDIISNSITVDGITLSQGDAGGFTIGTAAAGDLLVETAIGMDKNITSVLAADDDILLPSDVNVVTEPIGTTGYHIVATWPEVTMDRTVEVNEGIVYWDERWTNTSEDEIGLPFRHRAFLRNQLANFYLAGIPDTNEASTPASNPTMFVGTADNNGFGITAESDWLRLLMELQKDGGVGEIYTETLALAPDANVYFEITITPVKDNVGYWGFINKVRQRWGANEYCMERPYFLYYTLVPEECDPTEKMRRSLEHLGPIYLAQQPWLRGEMDWTVVRGGNYPKLSPPVTEGKCPDLDVNEFLTFQHRELYWDWLRTGVQRLHQPMPLEDVININSQQIPISSFVQINLPALPVKEGRVLVMRFNALLNWGSSVSGFQYSAKVKLNSTEITRYMADSNERLVARNPNFALVSDPNIRPVFNGSSLAIMYTDDSNGKGIWYGDDMTTDRLGTRFALNISDLDVNDASSNVLKIDNLSPLCPLVVQNIEIGWLPVSFLSDPQIKVIHLTHPSLETIYKPYQDLWTQASDGVITAMGSIFEDESYSDIWLGEYANKDWGILYYVPSPDSDYLSILMESIERSMDGCESDGIYCDEASWAWTRNYYRYNYGCWDGHSADLDSHGNIIRIKSDNAYVTEEAQLEFADAVYSRNKTFFCNTAAALRSVNNLQIPRFIEGGNYGGYAQSHLSGTPLILGNLGDQNTRKGLFESAKLILQNGCLYSPYETANLLLEGSDNFVCKMYPITVYQISPGCVAGRERYVTTVSGTTVWPGYPTVVKKYVYDSNGDLTSSDEVNVNGAQLLSLSVPSGGLIIAEIVKHSGTPNPVNGASDVNLTPILSWTAGFGTVSHDIYFGITEAAVANANHTSPEYKGRQTATTYSLGTLQLIKTYYWRIDEIGPNGEITIGPVWNFRTINEYSEKFQDITMAAAGTWTDVDLSSYGVSANQVVEIGIRNSSTTNARDAGVRTNGSGIDRKITLHAATTAGWDMTTMQVKTDANAKIEAYAANTTDVHIILIGVWNRGNYIEKFQTLTIGTTGSWQDVNLSAYGVAANQVAEVMASKKSTSTYIAGIRENGSSLERKITLHASTASAADCLVMQAKADANSKIEIWKGNTAVIFTLLGYWSSPPGTWTEKFENVGKPAQSSQWCNLYLGGIIPDYAICEFIIANSNTASNNVGLRKIGSSLNRLYNLHKSAAVSTYECGMMHVEANGSFQIQQYLQNQSDAVNFYLLGYWE